MYRWSVGQDGNMKPFIDRDYHSLDIRLIHTVDWIVWVHNVTTASVVGWDIIRRVASMRSDLCAWHANDMKGRACR